MRTVLSSGSDQPDLLGDLLAPISRVRVVAEIAMVLGVPETVAGEVVEAFDALVAGPLEKNLKKLNGRTLARRNPMISTARGTRTVSEWIVRVLADRETRRSRLTSASSRRRSPGS